MYCNVDSNGQSTHRETISLCLICQLMAKADYTAIPGITLTMAQTSLKAEISNYYQIICQASTHQDNFLESFATAQAIEKCGQS